MGNNVEYPKCSNQELILLQKIYHDLQQRSRSHLDLHLQQSLNCITKAIFLEYFALPGICGHQLFNVFNTKKRRIGLQEFIAGITRFNNASKEGKINLLFQIYNLNDNDKTQINREAFSTILCSTITPTISLLYDKIASLTHGYIREFRIKYKKLIPFDINNLIISFYGQQFLLHDSYIHQSEQSLFHQDKYTNHKTYLHEITKEAVKNITNHAFHNKKNNKLSQNDFQKWVLLNPGSLQLLHIAYTKHMNYSGRIHKKGILRTKIKKIGKFKSRYYVLAEHFLYIFKNENDDMPINILFILHWCICNLYKYGYYGIQLKPPYDNNIDYILYCSSSQDRNKWIDKLQLASCTTPISSDYDIRKIVNKGHFSVIHSAIHKKSGKECAIKIIDKKRIDSREQICLRNEINIFKLVNHPNIIQMKNVCFDKDNIYIVMELMRFGDLFDRWKKRRKFDEFSARQIMWQLFNVTQYLHSLGIVHRDLKPENIFCCDEMDDTKLVVSNFGLSKFTTPHEEMVSPCGTLAYVAPEVLSQTGYKRNVDVWSLGCIMFLLLRGILPFDGHTKEEIIDKTLNKKLYLNTRKWENLNVSDAAKDLLCKLLIKDPKDRISIQNALDHSWFIN